MASTSLPVHQIPASTILPTCELKHYRRWQRLYSNLKPAQQGYIPTAIEYDEFQQWLKRQDSGYFSDVFDDIIDHVERSTQDQITADDVLPIAPICRHTVHPLAAHRKLSRCVVCSIDVHISYLKLLQRALRNAGGRAPPCTLTTSDHQANAYKALVIGKLSALKELAELEFLAEQEATWSSQHPDAVPEDVQTAQKALELYWSETDGTTDSKPPSPKKKKVVFTHDTSDEPGRPEAYFYRKSPRYEPGKYAVSVLPDEHDDDAVSEDSEDYYQARPKTSFSSYIEELDILQDDEIPFADLDEDDGDSEWEDIDSDEEESHFTLAYGAYEYASDSVEESASFVVFSDD